MARYVLIVMSGPNAGHEKVLDDWHEKVHMREVVANPGFLGAQRYHFAEAQLDRPAGILPSDPEGAAPPRVAPWPYLIVYEIETDDIQAVVDALYADAPTQDPLPEGALDQSREGYYFFYKASSERIESPVETHPSVEPKDPVDAAQRARQFDALGSGA